MQKFSDQINFGEAITDRCKLELVLQSIDRDYMIKDFDAKMGTAAVSYTTSWSFDMILEVANAIGTREIEIGDFGCETCGNGATIYIRGIP